MLKEKLLGLKRKEIIVETEVGNVVVREMLTGENEAYDRSLYDIRNGKRVPKLEDAKEKLIIECCYDEEGNKLFELKDMPLVKQLPSRVSNALFEAAAELKDVQFEGAKLKEAVKN